MTRTRSFRRRFVPALQVIRNHHGRPLGRWLRRLEQLEVELLRELAAELRALGPANLGVEKVTGADVELDLGADGKLLAGFDQGAARRNIAQARALHLPLV